MKAILTGFGTFILLVVILYFGLITRWRFVLPVRMYIGVDFLKVMAPYIFGVSAIAAIISALLVYRFA